MTQQLFQEWRELKGSAGWRFKGRSRALVRWEDGQIDHQRAWPTPLLLVLDESSKYSLEFGNMHERVVSMSPRLTFLMQDWGIERSAPLKCLVGVRREAVGMLKTVYDIDIKTQHIEWCQLKFHSVPFGKLGSWACQCEMNNETFFALLIFYWMWNSPLLEPHSSRCARHTGVESKKWFQVLFFNKRIKLSMKVKWLWTIFRCRCWLSLLLITHACKEWWPSG